MAMRISFDFLVSGFTVGCSVSRDNFSFTSTDKSLSSLPSLQAVTVSAVAVVCSILALRFWQTLGYAAVSFTVPLPEQCGQEWKGEVLESPSIRVGSISHLG